MVHSQQIPVAGTVVAAETETLEIETGRCTESNNPSTQDVENISETESISEHIPSNSITQSDYGARTSESHNVLNAEAHEEKILKHSSLNIPYTHSPLSNNASIHDPSRQSASWPLDVLADDLLPLSEESPVNLALSSDLSKELSKDCGDTNKQQTESVPTPQLSEEDAPKESPRSDQYLDSLNEESSHKSNISIGDENSFEKSLHSDKSSGSEEIIKLDIRGQAAPKFPFPAAQIIFGPPPEGSDVISPDIETIPVFPNLLSPFLVGAGDSRIKVEEVFDDTTMPSKEHLLGRFPEPSVSKEPSPDESESSDKQSISSDKVEQDMLVEEVVVDYDMKDKEAEKIDDASIPTQPKSMAPDETSFSTITTDYRTICDEYNVKVLILIEKLCYCMWLLCAVILLCILMLLLTPLACYVFKFYRMHFLVYERVSKYFAVLSVY